MIAFAIIVFECGIYVVKPMENGVWVYFVIDEVCFVDQLPYVVNNCGGEGVLMHIKGI